VEKFYLAGKNRRRVVENWGLWGLEMSPPGFIVPTVSLRPFLFQKNFNESKNSSKKYILNALAALPE
jgi:hypothetical protein